MTLLSLSLSSVSLYKNIYIPVAVPNLFLRYSEHTHVTDSWALALCCWLYVSRGLSVWETKRNLTPDWGCWDVCRCIPLEIRIRSQSSAWGEGWNHQSVNGTGFYLIIYLFPCQFSFHQLSTFHTAVIRKRKIGPRRRYSPIGQLSPLHAL